MQHGDSDSHLVTRFLLQRDIIKWELEISFRNSFTGKWLQMGGATFCLTYNKFFGTLNILKTKRGFYGGKRYERPRPFD